MTNLPLYLRMYLACFAVLSPLHTPRIVSSDFQHNLLTVITKQRVTMGWYLTTGLILLEMPCKIELSDYIESLVSTTVDKCLILF